MTGRRLTFWVGFVTLYYAGIIYAAFKLGPDHHYYKVGKDVATFLLAVPAAWITFCFQRRVSYLQALRTLWTTTTKAVQGAMQYTHIAVPNQVEFAKVQMELSIALDEIRAVYTNVREVGLSSIGAKLMPQRSRQGIYPFEPLKQIFDEIDRLGFGVDRGAERRAAIRTNIKEHWVDAREGMLPEFDRAPPVTPISKYLGSDHEDDWKVEVKRAWIHRHDDMKQVRKDIIGHREALETALAASGLAAGKQFEVVQTKRVALGNAVEAARVTRDKVGALYDKEVPPGT